jgi:hypothetical protein
METKYLRVCLLKHNESKENDGKHNKMSKEGREDPAQFNRSDRQYLNDGEHNSVIAHLGRTTKKSSLRENWIQGGTLSLRVVSKLRRPEASTGITKPGRITQQS